MKRAVFFFSVLSLVTWLLLCDSPQESATNIEDTDVDLIIDSLSLSVDDDGIFQDTIGDSISFHVYRHFSDLIESFVVDFGEDTSIVFSTKKFKEDTFDISFVFTSTGSKVISIAIHRTDGTVGTIDSIIIIDIINRLPEFVKGKPDTLYEMDDGDSITIPLQATDTEGEDLTFFISETELPDSAFAKIVKDTSLVVFVPENSAGTSSVTIELTDEIDTVAVTVKVTITDRTPPNAPEYIGPSAVNTTKPTWARIGNDLCTMSSS